MNWTDDRVEILKKLWVEGLSAAQIAKQLACGVTRNAVIGKVHRLGLAGRTSPARPVTRARTGAPKSSTVRLKVAKSAGQPDVGTLRTADVNNDTGMLAIWAGDAMERGQMNVRDGGKAPATFSDGTFRENPSTPFARAVSRLESAGLTAKTVPLAFEYLGEKSSGDYGRIGWQNLQVFSDAESAVNIVVSQSTPNGGEAAKILFEAFSRTKPEFSTKTGEAAKVHVINGLAYGCEEMRSSAGETIYRIMATRQDGLTGPIDPVADLRTFENALTEMKCSPVGVEDGAPAIQTLSSNGTSYKPTDSKAAPEVGVVPFYLVDASPVEGNVDSLAGPSRCDNILKRLTVGTVAEHDKARRNKYFEKRNTESDGAQPNRPSLTHDRDLTTELIT